jgi:hypothetical protein
MGGLHTAGPDAGEKRGDGGVAPAKHAQGLAIGAGDGEGAVEAVCGQMLHEAEEPGQVGGVDAFFVEGEDKIALSGAEGEIAILDAFGDASEGYQGADWVFRKEGGKVFVGYFGVDGH